MDIYDTLWRDIPRVRSVAERSMSHHSSHHNHHLVDLRAQDSAKELSSILFSLFVSYSLASSLQDFPFVFTLISHPFSLLVTHLAGIFNGCQSPSLGMSRLRVRALPGTPWTPYGVLQFGGAGCYPDSAWHMADLSQCSVHRMGPWPRPSSPIHPRLQDTPPLIKIDNVTSQGNPLSTSNQHWCPLFCGTSH